MELTRNRSVDRRDLLALVGFVVLVNAVGAAPALLAGPDSAWFAGLRKPWFYPPPATFGVVWTLLFTLQAVALWLVWQRGRHGQADASATRTAVAAFVVQFACNVAWTPAFFGLQSPQLGLFVIGLLFVALVGTLVAFARVDRRAAALLVPYLLWVAFAAFLNYRIVQLNASGLTVV